MTFTTRWERRLQKLLAERNKPKPDRRIPDWSHADLETVQRRIRVVRMLVKRSKTIETLRRNQEELKQLTRRRRFLQRHQRNNRIALNRKKTEAARAELRRQRQLAKQTKAREDILKAWEQRDHTLRKSWTAESPQDMVAGRTYRWIGWTWAQLSPKVLKACGRVEGDVYRPSRWTKRVMVFTNGTWKEIEARDLNRYTPRISVQTKPAQPAPLEDTTQPTLLSLIDKRLEPSEDQPVSDDTFEYIVSQGRNDLLRGLAWTGRLTPEQMKRAAEVLAREL